MKIMARFLSLPVIILLGSILAILLFSLSGKVILMFEEFSVSRFTTLIVDKMKPWTNIGAGVLDCQIADWQVFRFGPNSLDPKKQKQKQRLRYPQAVVQNL